MFGGGNLKFILAGAVIVVAVAYLVIMGLQNSAVYFLTVGELQAKGSAAQNQLYRVSGNLVPGSLTHSNDGLSVEFQIADATPGASAPLMVEYHGGQVPDIMGDNVEIVAEGKLNGQNTFMANTVLAKCPSRLQDADPEEHDYSAPAA